MRLVHSKPLTATLLHGIPMCVSLPLALYTGRIQQKEGLAGTATKQHRIIIIRLPQ